MWVLDVAQGLWSQVLRVYQCSWTYNVHNTCMSVMSVVVTEQGLVILLGLTLLAQEACMYVCGITNQLWMKTTTV